MNKKHTILRNNLSGYKAIVFSDIDGTFADHDMRFDHGPMSFRLLNEAGFLLVLVSSKPAKAILGMLKACNASMPVIFENGGGIYLPNEFPKIRNETKIDSMRIIRLACNIENVEEKFVKVLKKFPIIKVFLPDMPKNFDLYFPILKTYFPHWSDRQVYEGVSPKKYFDLAFAFDKSRKIDNKDRSNFLNALMDESLELHMGGLFYHVTMGTDKGKTVNKFKRMLSLFKETVTYAIGDSKSDIPMLNSVDNGYLVKAYGGAFAVRRKDYPNINFINKFGTEAFIKFRNDLINS